MIALDLYCGAGAASMGMWRSDLFDTVIGVDIEPQPDYPFDFMECDALEFDVGSVSPDFVWASPPCQQFSLLRFLARSQDPEWDRRHPDLVAETRDILASLPWTCIENVPRAPIRPDIKLAGGNFGKKHFKRERWFEVSWETLSPEPIYTGPVLIQAYGRGGSDYRISARRRAHGLQATTTVAEIQEVMEVDWCSKRTSLAQMIPPAYATYIIEDAVRHGFGTKEETNA